MLLSQRKHDVTEIVGGGKSNHFAELRRTLFQEFSLRPQI